MGGLNMHKLGPPLNLIKLAHQCVSDLETGHYDPFYLLHEYFVTIVKHYEQSASNVMVVYSTENEKNG